MAYNIVSQADHELASNATDSDTSRSPSPHRTPQHILFQQLPLDHDHMGGHGLETATTGEDPIVDRLGSMIRAMNAVSYDTVEGDDYEIVDHSSRRSSSSVRAFPPLDTSATTTAHLDPPSPILRTPITDLPVPLSHPIPDLQSLQGAYVNNVARLEQSAERMSSSSADIGSEIRKLDLEQKRRSSSSASNFGLNSDGSPFRGNVQSRRASIQSVSRLAQVSEHESHGPYEDSANQIPLESISPPPGPLTVVNPSEVEVSQHDVYNNVPLDEFLRPVSAASNDTYQQARLLFTDFDGVHYIPSERSELVRQLSLTRPPLASRPESYKEPQTGENMVYYPAPVPRMLNLPPRLSHRPNAEREKRRTQLLSSVPAENRKSAPWLSGQNPAETQRNLTGTDMPPQLRASVFFEQPSASLDVNVKKESAVATLDSILDASAHAPVSAFIDHPYAGQLGPEVYGKRTRNKLSKDRRKTGSRSTLNLVPNAQDSDMKSISLESHPLHDQTEADAADTHEGHALRDSTDEGHRGGDHLQKDGELESDEADLPYTGPPTTLLAELELRKHELKQRKRNAAADSSMLHSTLLEMDAVAQKQSEHRRQKPVTLAWESTDMHNRDEGHDEDVPLGMLYPDKTKILEDTRPLGLMEQRQMEESEPLSRRRARLRGEVSPGPPRTSNRRPVTMYSHQMPKPTLSDSGDEEETLGERLKRLKGQNRTSTAVESEFASEILAELSHLKGDDEGATQKEETLGERRARLRKEAQAKAGRNSTMNIPRYRRSMADLLQAQRPTTSGRPLTQERHILPSPRHQHALDHRMSLQQFPVYQGPPTVSGMPHQVPVRPSGMPRPNTFYSDAIIGMQPLSYDVPKGLHPRAPGRIDPRQQDMINRWRQSIV